MHVLRKTHVDWVVCEVGVDLEEAVHSDRPPLRAYLSHPACVGAGRASMAGAEP